MKKKLTPKEAEKKIRAAAKAGNIKYSPTVRIREYGDFAKEFVKDVFDIEPVFMSDRSTINDFHTGNGLDTTYEKIAYMYGVDATGLTAIVDILDLITNTE